MSDELRLPDDLAACEARLAAQPIPASRIDRDQLMYRAGWAACQSQLATPNPPPSKGGARGGISATRAIAACSTLSAALAASLAVVVTLQFNPPATSFQRDIAAANPVATPSIIVAPVNPRSPPSAELMQFRRTSPRINLMQTGLLALRTQAVTNAWPQRDRQGAVTTDDQPPPAKTARELLQEFLPTEPPRSADFSLDKQTTLEQFPASV